jgi:hypothetical protein
VACPVQQRRRRSAGKEAQKGLTSVTAAANTILKRGGSVPPIGVDLRYRTSGSNNELKGEEMETKPEKTLQTSAVIAVKMCERPGCSAELGPLNRSGRCARHFHWKQPGKQRPIAGNGHMTAGAAVVKGYARKAPDVIARKATDESNGDHVGVKGSETASDLSRGFTEDRVNRLLLSFSAADKAKIAAAWLRGEI